MRPLHLPSGSASTLAGALLACWLVWVLVGFAAIGRRQIGDAGDAEGAQRLLQQLRQGPLASLPHRPLAIRLEPAACACEAGDERRWQAIAHSVRQRGGSTLRLSGALANPAGYTLLLLAADGQLRYAGPLHLPAAICGRSDGDLSAWVPQLLAGAASPLLLPSRCTC